MERSILFAHFIEPTHIGAGEGMGTVDRPVFRESTTGYPVVPGSTLKGATRSFLSDWETDERIAAFGADEDDIKKGADRNQGCMLWSDFRVLFLPARSLAGTFAWTTSMLALARFERFLRETVTADQHVGLAALRGLFDSAPPTSGSAYAASDQCPLRVSGADQAVVEGFVLTIQQAAGLSSLLGWLGSRVFGSEPYWSSFFAARALILAEDDFAHLCRESLPVEANIRIGEKGVTDDGSLRYTEFLPAETLMYSPLSILPPLSKPGDDELELSVDAKWEEWLGASPVVQFGADESKGKGVCRLCGIQSDDDGKTPSASKSERGE